MHLLQIDWGPSEILFSIGSFGIRYYSLMFVIGFLLGYNIVKKIYKNEHVNVEYVESLFMYVVVATLLGARLGEVFFYNWDYFQNHLVEILLPIKAVENASLFFGLIDGYEFVGYRGLASHGAAIGIISAMILYRRNYPYKTTLWILDRIVIPIALAAVLIRIGNFFNSEIVGDYTNNNFGVVFLNRGEIYPRHPAQLYEAFGYLISFYILWKAYWNSNKKEKAGYLFGFFLALIFSIRFLVEFVKVSQGGFEDALGILSTGQWLSVPLIGIGLFFMFRKTARPKNA